MSCLNSVRTLRSTRKALEESHTTAYSQVGDISAYAKSAEEAHEKYDAEKDTNLVRPEPDSQDLPPEWFLKVSKREVNLNTLLACF